MTAPWIDGPCELLQHAVDHLALDGDFDRRIAMVSIDNAVELTVKTYLGLPKRTRSRSGPSRRELENASESFPAILDLLEKYASDRVIGFSLDDIEWYHRIRNQLYHTGNGITVEKSKAGKYLKLALSLFQSLFDCPPELSHANAVRTKTGEFLALWTHSERLLHSKLPKRKRHEYAYYWKRNFLKQVNPEAEALYSSVAQFRNEVVYGGEPDIDKLQESTHHLSKLPGILGGLPDEPRKPLRVLHRSRQP